MNAKRSMPAAPLATSSDDTWTTHAEECLYVLAHDLRRIPLQPDTKRLHLHALELKREVAGWRREGPPDMPSRLQLLAEVESLARAARRYLQPARELVP
ncbi:MAG: hypothetical protein KIT84_30255 [Labilithrix sp.]|nr:hypothetical protein [Labilithrix sp.]MCW5815348.1 hypothetical protein [Labilithrix sp.]